MFIPGERAASTISLFGRRVFVRITVCPVFLVMSLTFSRALLRICTAALDTRSPHRAMFSPTIVYFEGIGKTAEEDERVCFFTYTPQ